MRITRKDVLIEDIEVDGIERIEVNVAEKVVRVYQVGDDRAIGSYWSPGELDDMIKALQEARKALSE